MDLYKVLRKVDSKILYILSILVIIIPLQYPLGLPITVSPWTRDAYDFLTGLPDGSIVGVDMAIMVVSLPASIPTMKLVLPYLMSRDFKILLWTHRVEGVISMETILPPLGLTNEHPLYGTKFANLGYLPGGEIGAMSFMNDIHGTFPNDYYGTPLEKLPVMEYFKTGKDFDLIWEEQPLIQVSLGQIQAPYNTPMIMAAQAGYATTALTFYPHQLKGVLVDIRGAAEFEYIMGKPGEALARLDAISLAHVLMIVAILIGNILFYLKKNTGKGGPNI